MSTIGIIMETLGNVTEMLPKFIETLKQLPIIIIHTCYYINQLNIFFQALADF